jgi:phosphinothricin acetyltransferase
LQVLTAQGYRQAMAGISLPNAASVALHEGLGFAPVGVYRSVGWKFGTWHDVGWWQRALAAPEAPPNGPVPLTALLPEILDAALMAGRARLRPPVP